MRKTLALFAAVGVLLTAGGCVSKNTEKFQQQVKKWVPMGTKTEKAQKIMEHKGFECNVIMHGSVFNTNDVDWLDCTRDQVWLHDWEARFILRDGKVIDYGTARVK